MAFEIGNRSTGKTFLWHELTRKRRWCSNSRETQTNKKEKNKLVLMAKSLVFISFARKSMAMICERKGTSCW